MLSSYKEYRKTYMVVPPLDYIEKKKISNLPIYDYSDISAPPIVYSRWCRSNNVGMMGKAALQTALNVGKTVAIMGVGGGAGLSLAETSHAANGKAIDLSKPSKDIVPDIAKIICEQEEIYWNRFHFLQTFQPAEGNLGDEKIGKSDETGYVGYKITSDGTYLEGYFGNDMTFRGVRISPDGERFLGTMNLRSGFFSDCVVIKPDGRRKFGAFIDGELTGGLYETNEFACFGIFENGRLYEGSYLKNDDTGFDGKWENGIPVE